MAHAIGKVGAIVPSLNNTLEPELNRMAPSGLGMFATRLRLQQGTADALRGMADRVEEAAELLMHAEVDVIAYCCTSGSLIDGADWEAALADRMRTTTGVPVVTTALAMVEAIKAVGMKKVSVATPYIDEVNETERQFLGCHGIRVINIEGLQFTRGDELHALDTDDAHSFCRDVCADDADGLFISCTDFATLPFLARLEAELDRPVVSSNTATFWKCLRMLGFGGTIEGYGRLFDRMHGEPGPN